MQLKTFTDKELLVRFKTSGDNAFLGELFKRHSMFAVGVCMKYLKDSDEAQDAAMQIFEKLLVDLRKHEVENFKAWLHTVCRNHCLMQLRKTSSVEMNSMELNENLVSGMESSESLHHEQDKELMLSALEQAIPQLNKQQQKCISLFYLKEKSYEEVAIETGFSMNEVKSFIQNGKRNLKIILSKKMHLSAVLLWILKLIN